MLYVSCPKHSGIYWNYYPFHSQLIIWRMTDYAPIQTQERKHCLLCYVHTSIFTSGKVDWSGTTLLLYFAVALGHDSRPTFTPVRSHYQPAHWWHQRYSVPPSAGPLLPLIFTKPATVLAVGLVCKNGELFFFKPGAEVSGQYNHNTAVCQQMLTANKTDCRWQFFLQRDSASQQ